MAKSTQKLSLEMIRGYDRNHTPFSAFVLCTAEDSENIKAAETGEKSLNLSKLKIIYKIMGHDVSPKIQSDVTEYLQHYYVSPQEEDIGLSGSVNTAIES